MLAQDSTATSSVSFAFVHAVPLVVYSNTNHDKEKCALPVICTDTLKSGGRYPDSGSRGWYYDRHTKGCKEVTYQGCVGHTNLFPTWSECQSSCGPTDGRCACPLDYQPVCASDGRVYGNECLAKCRGLGILSGMICDTDVACKLPKDPGPCKGAEERWYFDVVEGQCKKFHYGGCRGNTNNFQSLRECQASCGHVDGCPCPLLVDRPVCGENGHTYENLCEADCHKVKVVKEGKCDGEVICKLPSGDPGLCEAYIPSWYYDPQTKSCKAFVYGGCGGTANRFGTKKECEEMCLTRK